MGPPAMDRLNHERQQQQEANKVVRFNTYVQRTGVDTATRLLRRWSDNGVMESAVVSGSHDHNKLYLLLDPSGGHKTCSLECREPHGDNRNCNHIDRTSLWRGRVTERQDD